MLESQKSRKSTRKNGVSSTSAFSYTNSIDRKPLPLTTVELQKAGSRLLKLAPKRVLDVCRSVNLVCLVSFKGS